MIDEHFNRVWTDGHEKFSADVDSGLARIRAIIDAAYGDEAPTAPGTTKSEAVLAGLAATAVTVVLLGSLALLVSPGVVLA